MSSWALSIICLSMCCSWGPYVARSELAPPHLAVCRTGEEFLELSPRLRLFLARVRWASAVPLQTGRTWSRPSSPCRAIMRQATTLSASSFERPLAGQRVDPHPQLLPLLQGSVGLDGARQFQDRVASAFKVHLVNRRCFEHLDVDAPVGKCLSAQVFRRFRSPSTESRADALRDAR